MEDFPVRIAELLESSARRVREMTVDRIARVVKVVSLAPVMIVFALAGLVFLGIGMFRLLAEVSGGARIAYAIVGGLFLLAGALLWSRRTTTSKDSE